MKPETTIALISPGKDDVQSGPAPEWLEQFAGNLGLVLRKYPGKDLRIITPGSTGVPGIFKEADVWIILMHDSYSGGKYFELLGKAAGEAGDNPNRILRVDTSAGISSNVPESLANAFSVAMYEAGENPAEVEWLTEESGVYWSRLLDLAAEVNARTGEKASDETDGILVYLAQASFDMIRNRDVIKRELAEHGFRVVPSTDLRKQEGDLRSHIQNLVDRSRLAIHLLGNSYGETIGDNGQSIARVQVQYISEYLEAIDNDPVHSEKDIHRLIWIDPEYKLVDTDQEEFIKQLNRNIEKLHRTEIIQTPLELFKTLVVNRLRRPRTASKQTVQADEKEGKSLYIIHSPEDQENAGELAGNLGREGILTRMLDYQTDQRALLNDHKQYLQSCDGAVIYYEKSNRPWLRSKVMDLLKAPGLGRIRSLESRQILAAGKDTLEDYPLPGRVTVIREQDPSNALSRIKENLKQSIKKQ